jgi:hypothetical protein
MSGSPVLSRRGGGAVGVVVVGLPLDAQHYWLTSAQTQKIKRIT